MHRSLYVRFLVDFVNLCPSNLSWSWLILSTWSFYLSRVLCWYDRGHILRALLSLELNTFSVAAAVGVVGVDQGLVL